ncbi:MAG TPA: hypothetical protein VK866_18455, partial [Acidimicrobiales bacterium]|nr:hypothetical protein [Acidimicrobiales bacterium]
MSSRSPRYRLAALLVALVVGLAAAPAGATEGTPPESEVAPLSTGLTPSFSRVWPATTQSFYPTSGLARWVQSVPGIADVRIRSTADGTSQPSLWLAPNEPGPRPLLVVLHSWSAGYTQHLSIPYAQWARTHGWAMIHPDFRGRLDGADSTGSDLAVQDVIDAIDFAQAHADIDA